jgi:hypothetical protein
MGEVFLSPLYKDIGRAFEDKAFDMTSPAT